MNAFTKLVEDKTVMSLDAASQQWIFVCQRRGRMWTVRAKTQLTWIWEKKANGNFLQTLSNVSFYWNGVATFERQNVANFRMERSHKLSGYRQSVYATDVSCITSHHFDGVIFSKWHSVSQFHSHTSWLWDAEILCVMWASSSQWK